MDMNTNQHFLHCVSNFEGTSYEFVRCNHSFYFLLLLHKQILFFTSFQSFIQHYLKKEFRHKFSFFNRFTQTLHPHPLKSQNLQNATKVFCQCFLTYLSFARLCYDNAQEELEQLSKTNIYFNPTLIPRLFSSYKPLGLRLAENVYLWQEASRCRVSTLVNGQNIFCIQSLGKSFIRLKHTSKTKQQNRPKRSSRIRLLICPVTYSGSIL